MKKNEEINPECNLFPSSTACVFPPNVKHKDGGDEKKRHDQYWDWTAGNKTINTTVMNSIVVGTRTVVGHYLVRFPLLQTSKDYDDYCQSI